MISLDHDGRKQAADLSGAQIEQKRGEKIKNQAQQNLEPLLFEIPANPEQGYEGRGNKRRVCGNPRGQQAGEQEYRRQPGLKGNEGNL